MMPLVKETPCYDHSYFNAAKLREQFLSHGEVSVSKSFGITDAGCNVNCDFCTVASMYTNNWNGNRLRSGVEEEVDRFYQRSRGLPLDIEFVAYWGGMSRNNPQLARLCNIIDSANTSNGSIIGANIGLVLDKSILETLRDSGLAYLHSNLETSRRLYAKVVGCSNAYLFDKKIETLNLADEVGLDTITGILIGVGETLEDVAEQVENIREMPAKRVVVNFMDYDTEPRVARIFSHAKEQLTSKYAMQVLAFLRENIRPEQSLMIGSGVNHYMSRCFSEMLRIVDTIHIGSFLNLCGMTNTKGSVERIEETGYTIVRTPCFS